MKKEGPPPWGMKRVGCLMPTRSDGFGRSASGALETDCFRWGVKGGGGRPSSFVLLQHGGDGLGQGGAGIGLFEQGHVAEAFGQVQPVAIADRKSTRLNSSH